MAPSSAVAAVVGEEPAPLATVEGAWVCEWLGEGGTGRDGEEDGTSLVVLAAVVGAVGAGELKLGGIKNRSAENRERPLSVVRAGDDDDDDDDGDDEEARGEEAPAS
mmetsp:Transcript_8010/g.15267  ORF Transcript_8010/g.15267 Transcript_8010/m.15267 type:complete len:107 (+) Transcript_8010:509-829(+)